MYRMCITTWDKIKRPFVNRQMAFLTKSFSELAKSIFRLSFGKPVRFAKAKNPESESYDFNRYK